MPRKSVYLDYQGSSPIDPRVRDAILEAWTTPGNPSAEDHAFGWEAMGKVERAREQVAAAIGAQSDEVIFTSGSTEANNIAILGGATGAPLDRRRILVSSIEHKSASEAARAAEGMGFEVVVVRTSSSGVVTPEELASLIDETVAIVSVMAVNNEIGTVQPIKRLADVAHSKGAFFHTDATQALNSGVVDVAAWGVDALSISGHKICGPSGVGALYIASDAPWRLKALTHGGGQERGLRPGTVPTALCVGLGLACEIVSREGESERVRVRFLRDAFERSLRTLVPEAVVTCEQSERHPGCLHIRLPGVSASDLLLQLQPEVAASTGSACTSGVVGPSHVARAIGMSYQEASEVIRFSMGRFSTSEEIELAVDAIGAALARQRAWNGWTCN